MKSPIELGSGPARFSQKLRDLARSLHPAEQQQWNPEPSEYRIIHTPDRPRRSIGRGEIPSEAECAAFILGMQQQEKERRQAKTRLGHDTRAKRWPPVEGTVSVPEYKGGVARGRGSEVMSLHDAERQETVRHSRRWENPRSAPRPEQGVYNLEDFPDPLRARVSSQPTIDGSPIPHPLDARQSVPRGSGHEVFPRSMATSTARGSIPDAYLPTRQSRNQAYGHGDESWDKTGKRDSRSSTQARIGPLSSDDDDDNVDNDEPPDDVYTTPLSPTGHYQPPPPLAATAAMPAAPAGKCRMPACTAPALRSRGLCEVCESDFLPRASMFVGAVTAAAARRPPASSPGVRGPPLVPPPPLADRPARPSARKRPGHIAHQMRIISPPESPREISVRVSPTAERRGLVDPRLRGEGHGRSAAEMMHLEGPGCGRGGVVCDADATLADVGVRGTGRGGPIYRQAEGGRQQLRRSCQPPEAGAQAGMDRGDVHAAGGAIMEDWVGSDYYLTSAYFPEGHSESEYEDERVAVGDSDSDEEAVLSPILGGMSRGEDKGEDRGECGQGPARVDSGSR